MLFPFMLAFTSVIYVVYANEFFFISSAPGAEELSIMRRYRVYGKGNWFMALKICSTNGMRLVKIDDQQKSDEITYYLSKLSAISGPFWTLGSKLLDGTTWSFLGDPVKYFNWAEEYPKNKDFKKCIQVNRDGLWNNKNCYIERYILCERNETGPSFTFS